VDKANLYATGRLWRQTADLVARDRGLPVEHRFVDRAAFELGSGAEVPAVIVTEGLLGDILSDLAAGRAGSPALCGSASIHPGTPARGRCQGLFEPAHGSAPRRTGRDQVNPLGGYLALVALLQHFDETRELGVRLRTATHAVLRQGPWTYDLAPEGTPPAATSVVADAVLAVFDSLGREAAPAGVEDVAAVAEPDVRVPAEVLESWTVEVLEAVGVRTTHARDVSRVLAYADLSGIDSHGIARLPAYVAAVGAGVIRVDGDPTVHSDGGAVALVDGHGLLGHPVTTVALTEALDRAGRYGVGWVNVRGSSHHGASGSYVYDAAKLGLVGLAATNTGPIVAPTGTARPSFGTNPLALGMPVAGEEPMVFDMATSAVAGGTFEIALRLGKPVPLGWGLAERSSHHGLGLLVELLTAVLAGGPMGPAVGNLTARALSGPPATSHLVVVLDPARLGDPARMQAETARLLAELRALDPVDADLPVRTPGRRSAAERARRRAEGVPLDAETHRALVALGEQVGRPLGAPVRG
jgi:LDH2 family malate/lactate/ureidoglycolate dehydrogenase